MAKRKQRTLPTPPTDTPPPPMKPPRPEPPEVHCTYDVVTGDTLSDLVKQVNIECQEKGAIPTGGPMAVFGTNVTEPYSQAVIYPVEQ